ncbi:MAG: hypothetical protein IMF19_04420 [Proteobacteria bacterium]|nr:hypothetical protein [Pseudomonadota bacterium]
MLLDTINNSALLSKQDLDSLEILSGELQETFVKTQIHRTRTEMEISVLNSTKFPTPALKYWQAMREQNVMFTELVLLSYEYRKNQVEIKILERDIAKEQNNLESELLQIECEKKTFVGRQQERVAKARIGEIKNWSDIKEREAQQMSEEELAEVDNSQLIGYTKRWINQSIIMGDSGSPPERQNLLGQLRSGILACIGKGILNKVLEGFDPRIQKQIKEEYRIK